jgi:hypothetical protein
MISMRAVTIEFTNAAGQHVALNATAEPDDNATVRISRAGPAPGDDPLARIVEDRAIRTAISAMSWIQVSPLDIHAEDLGDGRYRLLTPAPAQPRRQKSPTPSAPAWRRAARTV